MSNDQYKLCEAELKAIIRSSFRAGQLWGETYSTWFIPSVQDNRCKIDEQVKRVMEVFSETKMPSPVELQKPPGESGLGCV